MKEGVVGVGYWFLVAGSGLWCLAFHPSSLGLQLFLRK
jgi:hypothetical protein